MGHTRTVSRSIIDDICHRLKMIEREIHALQNKKRKAIPIYDKAHLPRSIVNGQLFFTADSKEFGFISDGAAHYAKTTKVNL